MSVLPLNPWQTADKALVSTISTPRLTQNPDQTSAPVLAPIPELAPNSNSARLLAPIPKLTLIPKLNST